MLRILPRIRLLIIQVLDEFVVGSGKESTHQRTEPVDPVVAGEGVGGDGGTKGTGRVEGTAGEVDT